jgi:glutathione S-transferase
LSRPEDTAADEGGEQSELVFYRCPTPTDFLCPCGAVARRLRKLDLPHRTERVPYRRTDRPEIIELTGQKRVPLLIDGDEIVHDSKRILEYLGWRYGTAQAGDPHGGGAEGSSTERA